MKDYFNRLRLRRHKEKALFEVRKDLEYIQAFKKDMLEYDETNARRRMSQLKKKEDKTEEEQAEWNGIIDTLSESKAVKNEFEKSKQLEQDLLNYLSII